MSLNFKRTNFVIVVYLSVIGAFTAWSYMRVPETYSEKRADNFVLSEEMPISIGHGILGNLSASTEPVDILVEREAHFRIPRNYIYTISPDRRERSVSIALVTLFPAFEGVTVDGNNGSTIKESDKNLSWKNKQNIVWMYSTTKPYDPEHDPDTILFKSETNEPDTHWQYGLLKSLKRSNIGQDVYFSRSNDEKKAYAVFCESLDLKIQDRTCNIYFRISPKIVIQYNFLRDLLPHWQEIHQKTTSLIQSFIVQDGK